MHSILAEVGATEMSGCVDDIHTEVKTIEVSGCVDDVLAEMLATEVTGMMLRCGPLSSRMLTYLLR
jgi:hypothetical protein